MSNVTTTTTTGFAPQMQEYGLAAAGHVMNLGQQAYQPYSNSINAFSAPVSGLQVSGQQTINNAANLSQPYYAKATSFLNDYANAATGALGQSYNTINNAQNTGAAYNQAGMTGYQGAVQTGNAYNRAATAGYAGAPAAASGYNNMAGQGYVGAYNTAAPYTQTATAGYAAAPGTSAPYNAAAGQGYLGAAQAAAPLNQAATAGYANAPGASAPYNAAAGQGYLGAAQAAAPLNQAAIQGYGAAPGASASQNAAAQAGYTGAASAANPYNQTASQGYAAAPGLSQAQNSAAQAAYANAPGSVSQYNKSALQGYGNSLTAAAPLNQAAIQGYTGATSAADPYNLAAAQGYASAPGVATPYNQMATSAINNAVGAGAGYNQSAMANYTGGLAASMPYTLGGAQAVNATPIDAAAINQYLSPFLNDVYKTTLAGQSVQNAQQSSALQGTAAQAGAFGGDRAGIAQANMAYQQNLANSQTNANLLNTGFTNALAAAQNQQNVNLGAQQANRAAQASTGQNIYNQMSTTGQNIAGLGQQVYGQNLGASTALSGLGNQMFGQQTAAAQGVGNIGQQIYGQKIGAAQGLGNMGQQISNQNINAAQGIGNIGQQQFGQQIAGAAGQLAAGNQSYNQAMGAAAGQANVGNQVYNQGAQTAAGQLAVGNQNYNQAMGAAQGLGNMAQQTYGQGATTAAGLLGVGNQGYNQALGAAQGLGNMAQQTYGQGATTAAGLLGVGNQNFAQTMGATQGIGAMGNQAFTQGNQTANSLAGLGNQTFNQQIASSQGLAGLGNQVYNQEAQAAQAALATGQNAFTQGSQAAQQQAAIGNSFNNMAVSDATTLGSLGGAAQTSALQGGQAQIAAGTLDQAQLQKGIDALVAQQKQQQAFDYSQASWLTNNLATIAGGLTGQTTTQTTPGFIFGARGGAMKAPTRAMGGLVPDAASEGGTVSMGRAGQGFADGGMPDPYMTNMYNILGSIYPNQNPAPPAGALAPSAPSGGFAPVPNGLPALYNGAQYAGNPFAALLNTASQINPANYAPAKTAATPVATGYPSSVYDPTALLAPKATRTPWWKPPEAAKPAAATDATAATGVGLVPGGSEANAAGPSGQGGNLAGALGLVNGDAFAGAKGAYGGLLGGIKSGLMDLLGLGGTQSIDMQGSADAPVGGGVGTPMGPGDFGTVTAGRNTKDDAMGTQGKGVASAPTIAVSQQDLPAVVGPTVDLAMAMTGAAGTSMGPGGFGTVGAGRNTKDDATGTQNQNIPGGTTIGQGPLGPDEIGDAATAAAAAAAAANPAIDVETSDLGLGGSGTIGGTGTGNNNSNPSEVPSEVNSGNNNGPSGNGDSGEGSGEGASGKYRGGLIRPHRREGGPVRKHYATSGGVGIADSLYSNDPNSYGYIFGQGTSPASLDQNSYGSPAMNARMGERQQSALQQLASLGNTLGGLKTGAGVIGDLLGGAAKLLGFEQGGRVGRAGGGLVGRHGYAGDGTVDGQDDTAPASRSLDQIIQSGNANYEAAQPQNVQAVIDREAAKRNIPIPLARGLFRQESNYNPSITGSAGESGLGQIKPSTARDPGFGMTGVDPSMLVGAENIDNNVKFALDYLQARGKAVGATDLNDPLHQNAALAAYNSGGDPNYVNNVRARINEAGGDGRGLAPSFANNNVTGRTAGLMPGGNNNETPNGNLSPVNQAASDAAVRIANSLGNAKPDTTETPNWFERNQNWLAPVLMGLAGASGKRTLAGAVVGAGAGAVQGLQAAQESASKRKLQAGQTEQATAGAQSSGASAVQALGSASMTPAQIALIKSQQGQTEANTTAVLAELPAKINLLEQQGVLTAAQAAEIRLLSPVNAQLKLTEMGLNVARANESGARVPEINAATQKVIAETNQTNALTAPRAAQIAAAAGLDEAKVAEINAGLIKIIPTHGVGTGYVLFDTRDKTVKDFSLSSIIGTQPQPATPNGGGATGAPKIIVPPPSQSPITDISDHLKLNPSYVPPSQERLIASQFALGDNSMAAARNRASADIEHLNGVVDTSNKTQVYLAEMKHQADNLPATGVLTSGAGADQRLALAKNANMFSRAFGGGDVFDGSSVASVEALNKQTVQMGQELSKTLGREPGFIIQQTIGSVPGFQNTDMGFKRVSAAIQMATQAAKDQANFITSFNNKYGQTDDARKLFWELNPPQSYADRAILLTLSPGVIKEIQKYGPNIQSQVDKVYGKGMTELALKYYPPVRPNGG